MPRNKLIEQRIELLSGETVHHAFVILEIIAVDGLRRWNLGSVRYEQASSLGGLLSRLSTLQFLAGPENRSQALLRALQKPQPIAQRDDHSLGTRDAQSNAQSPLSPCVKLRVYGATLKMSFRQGFVR